MVNYSLSAICISESKPASQQGIQLFVEFPDAQARKSKKVDVEMMMKRKINRVKKEYQVYMHKVHVLCWLGHGNFVSQVLNDRELMTAALSLVPSQECYPGLRVDMKYVEQITSWYKDKLTLKQDKNEDKFKPKQSPLKDLLLQQMEKRVVTTKKYLVFIFVTMLRALGLQCRVMFNFVTLPIKPPSSELCSLSTKAKDEKASSDKSKQPADKKEVKKEVKAKENATGPSTSKTKKLIVPQLDGNYDSSFFSDDDENIMQMDGSDDPAPSRTRSTRTCKRTKAAENTKVEDEDVSPPKIPKNVGTASPKPTKKQEDSKVEKTTRTRKGKTENETVKEKSVDKELNKKEINTEKTTKTTTRAQKLNAETSKVSVKKEKSPVKKPTVASVRSSTRNQVSLKNTTADSAKKTPSKSVPRIAVTDENAKDVSSKFFEDTSPQKKPRLSRQRSQTTNPAASKTKVEVKENVSKAKTRTKSAPGTALEKSKYFEKEPPKKVTPRKTAKQIKDEIKATCSQRVSHRDLAKAQKGKNDVTNDLVDIIKTRIKVAKNAAKQGIVKGK